MRVEVLIDGLGHGGAEALLGDLAAGAEAVGLELGVAYLFDKDGSAAAGRLRARGVDPVHLPTDGLLRPGAMRTVREHLAARRPDVVHTQLSYADVHGGLAARSLGLPVVSTVHVMDWSDADVRERRKLGLYAAARRACAARVVCVSDAARAAYLARGWDRPDRVETVRNGVARAARPGAGAAVRAELGIAPDELVVTTLSVLRPGKGHEVAFGGVRMLLDLVDLPAPVRLLVAGDGPERERLEALAAPLGDRVVFAGHRPDVMAVLDASDVLLHPTRADALPTALIEALAAGVPVVATRVGGVPEVVRHGETGLLLAPPAERASVAGALRLLLVDPARRAAMGAAARAAYARGFSAGAWAGRLRGLYEAVA
jgi:glycosyltransferase involved in cell wall biosynthesis